MTSVSPENTLVIILGASSWPKANLEGGQVFSNSAQDLREYFLDPEGFRLPETNLLDLFDSPESPTSQIIKLGDFLRDQRDKGSFKDLILYYVGHGSFHGSSDDYYLALKTSQRDREHITSLRVENLATEIRKQSRHMRRFVLFDCCYAGNAATIFQSNQNQCVARKTTEAFRNGTLVYCSSNKNDRSLAPNITRYTMFTGSLLNALRQGKSDFPPKLTMSDVDDLVWKNIQHTFEENYAVRPELHSPDQQKGDLRYVQLFPNQALAKNIVIEGKKKPASKERLESREEISRELFVKIDELAEVFVEPYITLTNPIDMKKGGEHYNSFEYIENFVDEKTWIEDGRNRLFILGGAGMGKTSLLAMLKYKFSIDHKYEYVIYRIMEDNFNEIIKREMKYKTVLLLDALDEDLANFGKFEKRLARLMNISRGYHKVIITCRTQYFPTNIIGKGEKVEICGYRCKIIYLKYFDDDQVKKYLDKRFQQMPEKIELAKLVLNQIDDLQFRPMILSSIEDLIGEGRKFENIFEIYEYLVDVWLRRELRRDIWGDKIPSLKDLVKAVTFIAVKLFSEGRTKLPEAELNTLIKKNSFLKSLENFQAGDKSLLNKDSEGNFVFSHRSIQEFLIVYQIKRTKKSKPGLQPSDLILEFMKFVDLRGAWIPFDFRYHNLEGFDFSGSNLSNEIIDGEKKYKCKDAASFEGVNLEDCKFRNCTLNRVNFSKSILKNTDLSYSTLIGAYFLKADLNHCILDYTNVKDADFKDVLFRIIRRKVYSGHFDQDMNDEIELNFSTEGTDLEGVINAPREFNLLD